MATIVLGAVGAGIGSIFGNPMLGFSVGVSLAGVLFPPRLAAQDRGKLDDLRLTGSGYGVMIPQAWGQARIGGNIIWLSHYLNGTAVPSDTADAVNLLETVMSEEQGGKGAPSATINNYTYTASFAVAICRGPILRVNKIWAEDQVIYDRAASPATKYNVTIYYGDEEQIADPLIETFEGVGQVPGYRGLAYVVFEDLLLTDWGNRIPALSFELEAPGTSVHEILEDLAYQCGLTPADICFCRDCVEVPGFVLNQRTAAKSVVEPLLRVFQNDLAEVGGKLVSQKRGGSVVATIDADDLGARIASAKGEPPTRLTTTRGNELELPQRLDVTYFSPDRNYEQANQEAMRYARPLVQDAVTVNTPLVMGDDSARQAAERMLYTAWLERTEYTGALPPRYLRLVPGSVVNLPVNGALVRVRFTQDDVGLFAEMRVQAVEDDEAAGLLSQSVSGGATGISAPSVTEVVPTDFDLFGAFEFRDSDGLNPGFYVAATGATGWRGAAIYYSSDGGTNWTFGGSVRDRAVWGETASVLANGVTAEAWDTGHSVDVTLQTTGSLATTSRPDVVAGNNNALIGEEVAGFSTVALTGALAYTLSDLYRGRRSTAMTGHSSPERFWLLTPAIVRVKVPTSLIGSTLDVKCVSPGQTLADVTAQTVTIVANNYPYARPGEGGSISGDAEGEFLVCLDGSTFEPVFLVTDPDNGILLDSEGNPLVSRPGH